MGSKDTKPKCEKRLTIMFRVSRWKSVWRAFRAFFTMVIDEAVRRASREEAMCTRRAACNTHTLLSLSQ